MASAALPDAATLSSLPETALTAVLDLLFEPNSDLHALAVPAMRTSAFGSYDGLIDAVRDELMAMQQKAADADRRPLLSILGAHPRLGEKKVTSAQSAAEQAQLHAGSGEAEQLAALNREYEARFPGCGTSCSSTEGRGTSSWRTCASASPGETWPWRRRRPSR